MNLKEELCNYLIKNDIVKESDVIRHSYTKSRFKNEMKDIKQNNICPTLDTRCDCLGVVVKDKSIEGDNMLRGGKQVNETIEKNIDKFKEGKVLNMDLYNRTVNEELSQTLTDPTHNSQRLYDGLRIRKLTPKECWRLMGFDDIDFEKASKVNSNAQLYKQAGNSIVVNVLEAILKNLLLETNNDNVIEGQMTIYDFINE